MRIAFTGSHRTGKSTLIGALSALLPKYKAVDEPYHLMEEDGHDFTHPPSLDDFVAQLERSIAEVNGAGADALFDRCPVDFLGYILSHEDAGSFDLDEWLPHVEEAVRMLDLIVFVPIESPDRIAFASSDDDDDSRTIVDEKLRELLLDDPFDLDLKVLQVEGEPEARAARVLERIRRETR